MSLTLEIPDAVEQALRLPKGHRQRELMLELAVALYARGILSLEELAQDLEYARGE